MEVHTVKHVAQEPTVLDMVTVYVRSVRLENIVLTPERLAAASVRWDTLPHQRDPAYARLANEVHTRRGPVPALVISAKWACSLVLLHQHFALCAKLGAMQHLKLAHPAHIAVPVYLERLRVALSAQSVPEAFSWKILDRRRAMPVLVAMLRQTI